MGWVFAEIPVHNVVCTYGLAVAFIDCTTVPEFVFNIVVFMLRLLLLYVNLFFNVEVIFGGISVNLSAFQSGGNLRGRKHSELRSPLFPLALPLSGHAILSYAVEMC